MRLMVCPAYNLSLRDQTVLQEDPQLWLSIVLLIFTTARRKSFYWRLGDGEAVAITSTASLPFDATGADPRIRPAQKGVGLP
jgi:hypothetical protein